MQGISFDCVAQAVYFFGHTNCNVFWFDKNISLFRLMSKIKLGKYLVENIFVKIHYLLYKILKKQELSKKETRNIFYDYFITPIATFQSKSDVNFWCNINNCNIIDYARTSGNCHVFIIKKKM